MSSPSHTYGLRRKAPLPLVPTATPPVQSPLFSSASPIPHVIEASRQQSIIPGGSRTSRKRDRSRSQMVLPTVYPTPSKGRKIDRTQPLVTLISPTPESRRTEKPPPSQPTPTSSQSTDLGNIIAESTPTSRKEPVGIKMPVARHLRVKGGSQRQPALVRSQARGSSSQNRGSQGGSGSHDSDIEIISISRNVMHRQVASTSEQTIKLKIPARVKPPRIPPSKSNQATQTESSIAWGKSAAGTVARASTSSLDGEEVRRVLELDETEYSYLEMKLLEERMSSWGQYSNAEEEMSTIVQNYLSLEKELAETKEELRLVKSHKKRKCSTALPDTNTENALSHISKHS